jgi:3-hydroxy-9,10-secoandrosta-1,3,5(10)-triene-9,17-dione monooxygenase reductase component
MNQVSEQDFKSAMRCLVTSVTVLSTANIQGELFGLTVNSFASVSLNPPLVLFCITYKSSSLQAIRSSGTFAINILNHSQESISRHFASSGQEKFAIINYEIGSISGAPLISDANCWIECSLEKEYEGGDHAIILGRVKKVTVNNDSRPLAYYNGNYQ